MLRCPGVAGLVPLEAWPFHLVDATCVLAQAPEHGLQESVTSPPSDTALRLPLHEKDPVVPWPPPGNPVDPRPVSWRAAVAHCGLGWSEAAPRAQHWQADPSGTTVTCALVPGTLPVGGATFASFF